MSPHKNHPAAAPVLQERVSLLSIYVGSVQYTDCVYENLHASCFINTGESGQSLESLSMLHLVGVFNSRFDSL